jgi:hypothetical protein
MSYNSIKRTETLIMSGHHPAPPQPPAGVVTSGPGPLGA